MWCLFLVAIFTGLVAYNFMIKDILQVAYNARVDNVFTQNMTLSAVVMSIVAGLLGFVTLFILLNPSLNERFRVGLTNFVTESV